MKILEHSATRLVIKEQLVGIWLLSVGAVLTGLFMFFLFEPPVDWVGAGCVALGGVFVSLTPSETIVFDRDAGNLTVRKYHLMRQSSFNYPMAAVEAVKVDSLEVVGTRFYRVNLQLISGRQITISQTISTDWQSQQSILRHIRGFLRSASLNESSPTTPLTQPAPEQSGSC